MPSLTTETVQWQAERAELHSALESRLFVRSPALSHLLSYLCEKTFAGQSDQIKEYSIALEVFGRRESFDQDADSIVRVEANRLRKRLAEFYATERAEHPLRITIPVGQYVPVFEKVGMRRSEGIDSSGGTGNRGGERHPPSWIFIVVLAAVGVSLLAVASVLVLHTKTKQNTAAQTSVSQQVATEPAIGLPVGEEIRVLAGSSRKYVDHAGKIWAPDAQFSAGTAVASNIQQVWRTQDPIIYRNSRQGEFAYDFPLKPGIYELHLHFAEMFYGSENPGGGGEGSRVMTVRANGQVLLHDFDVLADSGGARTAGVKVFPDISPGTDGHLHLSFSSAGSGTAMVSAIEILPGVRGHIRPVRLVARDVPYYSNDSRWWSPDTYFKEGQLSTSREAAVNTDDPEFYETERWGHFSYAIPVSPGKYTLTLYFIDRDQGSGVTGGGEQEERTFSVFCNGQTILSNLNIRDEAGENRPLVRKIKSLEPNAQGKLLLEFVPVTRYATVTAIEVVPE